MPNFDKFERKRKSIAIVAISFFAIIVALLTWFISNEIDKLSNDPLIFRNWIASFGFFGKFIFTGLAAIQVVLAVIPGGPVQVAAGYAFGLIEGSIWCTLGIQLGSAIAFLLARYLGMKVITLFFPREKIDNIKFLQNSKRLDLIVFTCFLIPGAPKDLLTYFCGMTKIPFVKFMLITTVARIPSIIISVMSGNALINQDYATALIIMISLAVCSGIGLLIYNKLMSKESKR